MGFAIFFFLAWLISGVFLILQKKLSIVENTFVFLITVIVIINVSWISIEEMKLIQLTKSSIGFTGYILNRSVIIPMLVILQLNILERSKTFFKKVLIMVFTVIIMLGLSFISNYFNITEYTKWNYGYDVIYYLLLQLIANFSYKFFRKVTEKVVEYSWYYGNSLIKMKFIS